MRVVAGEAKGRRLLSPPASVTRAATDRIRQSLFGILEPILGHPGLRDALAADAVVVARALRKHPPEVPPHARVERDRTIGEESVLFLRYDAARPPER